MYYSSSLVSGDVFGKSKRVNTMYKLEEKILLEALAYEEYRHEIDSLLQQGKVTGNTQSVERLEFTKLNIQRMNRLDKTVMLIPELKQAIDALPLHQTWIMLAHGWCGDCAQLIPVFAKVAAESKGKISLHLLNPDQYPEVMEAYSTNGSHAVPKLVMLQESTQEVLGMWGPRPAPAQAIMRKWKASEGKISKSDFEMELHTWYAKDRTNTTQQELVSLVQGKM